MGIQNKKVTVAIATYNGELYLNQQLKSIVTQSHHIDEIIIVDDLSTDNTRNLLLLFAEQNPQLTIKTILNKENVGVNKAFEIALTASSGEFIFISDQDDIWDENKVQITMDKWDGSLLTCSDAKIVDASLKTLYESELVVTHSHLYTYDMQFLFSNCVSGHNMMVKKELLEKVLPFPERMIYDQWLALVAKSHSSLQIINDSLCLHRMHMSNSHNDFTGNKKTTKSRKSIIRKKQRIEDTYSGITEGAHALLRHTPRNDQKLLEKIIHHGENLEHRIFNFPLFIHLLKLKDKLFLDRKGYQKFRVIKNICVGKRGFWLKF